MNSIKLGRGVCSVLIVLLILQSVVREILTAEKNPDM